MKPLFIILSIFLTACSKNNTGLSATTSEAPKIVSYSFYKNFDAGEYRPAFNVDIISDTTIAKLVLVLSPSYVRYEISNPVTGKYKLYDHISSYPTYAQSYYYYISLQKKDGSIISTDPFQVY